MTAGLKTLVTLLVLAGLLVLAALWGFSAATKPFPGKSDPPVCVDRAVSEGDKVFSTDVTVSVENAGDRNGLASFTLDLFKERGFGEGETGNAPKGADVAYAEVWTTDPKSPAVQLVESWLGPRSQVVDHKEDTPGVLVVVGDGFDRLVKGSKKVVASGSATICSPSYS